MLCFRCGSYNADDVQKCTVCGQEFVDRGGKAVGPVRKTTTSSHQALIFAPGEVIAGRYRVIELIGQGGVGAVYRARDNEVDVDVALKGVSPNLLQTEEEQKQFSKAIKAARKLQHPNIVRIYDEGHHQQPTRRFFTMKLLEGLTLRKIIRLRHDKQQAFSPEELGPIFQQLGEALDYAHKTTWHGDLKPENVVVLPDLLKVTDFGLVKALPLKPFLGIAKSRSKGFPYIAPELRVESQSIDGRCDVYSLGVILAEMLTGLVYDGHFSRAFTAALEQLPTRLDGLIRRALSEHPDGRFAKASDLAKELDVALSALGSQPLPLPTQPRDSSTTLPRPEGKGDGRGHEPARSRAMPPPPPLETNPSQSVPPVATPEVDDDGSLLEIGQSQVLLLDGLGAGTADARRPRDGGRREDDEVRRRRLEAVGAHRADDTIDEPIQRRSPRDDIDTSPGGKPAPRDDARPSSVPPRVEDLVDALSSEEAADGLVPPPLPENLGSASSADEMPVAALAISHLSTAEGDAIAAARAPAAVLSEPSEPSAQEPPRVSAADEDDPDTGATQPLPSLSMSGETGETGETGQGQDRNGEFRPLTADPSDEITTGERTAVPRSEAGEAIHDALTALKRHPRAGIVDDEAVREALNRTEGTALDHERPPPLPTTNAPDAAPTSPSEGAPESLAGGDLRPPTLDPGVLGDHDLQAPALGAPHLRPVAPPRPTGRGAPHPLLLVAGVAAVVLVILYGGRHVMRGDSVQREDGALVTVHRSTGEETPDTGSAGDAGVLVTDAGPVGGASATAPVPTASGSTASGLTASGLTASGLIASGSTASGATAASAAPGVLAPGAGAGNDRATTERADAGARAAAEMERREALEKVAGTEGTPPSGPLDTKTATAMQAATTPGPATTAGTTATTDGLAGGASSPRVDVAVASGECPSGMARIEAGVFTFGSSGSDPMRNFGEIDASTVEVKTFCVDYYEAPNRKDALPDTGVSWQAAKTKCEQRGRRLCTETEWERACKGPGSSRFPYGNTYDADVCNTEDADGKPRSPARPIDFKKCRSGFKVFMLAGNVEEWVQDAAGGQRIVKGGAADRPDFASRCSARRTVAARTTSGSIGFRCCADLR
jgi:serine/threonine protein kinase/formylglycine-generating enzyme required for sulfatase activity